MPVYEFECPMCSALKEVYRSIDHCSDPETCSVCNHFMNRKFSCQFNMGVTRQNRNNLSVQHKRHEGDMAGNLIEMGNENPDPPDNTKSYDLGPKELQGCETLNSLPE